MPFNLLFCNWGCCTIPQRVVFAIVAHLGIQNCYNLRVVLNVAINEMVQRENKSSSLVACTNLPVPDQKITGGTYPWDSNVEALIKYAFYFGYFVGHFPGGWLSDKLGGRWVLEISMVLSAVVTVLYPLGMSMTRGDVATAVILRTLLGIFQGPVVPTISSLVSNWVPKRQRALLGGIAFSGSYLGQAFGSILTGLIVYHSKNWPYAFYFWGFVTLLWCGLCFLTVFSYPSLHPFITKEEKTFLEQEIQRKRTFKVPWKEVLKCPPVWAILSGHFGHAYVAFVMSADLPKYMRDILNLNIKSYGIFSAIPFLGAWISSICFGWLSDYITNNTHIKTITIRKTYTFVSNMGPALYSLTAVYVGCTREWAVILYVLALIAMGASQPGLKVNVNDLTVNYGGMIMGVINGFGALAGILGLGITGWVSRERTFAEWRMIMWIMVAISLATTLVYMVLAASERQEWDVVKEEVD